MTPTRAPRDEAGHDERSRLVYQDVRLAGDRQPGDANGER
jgi:hypothetical protein